MRLGFSALDRSVCVWIARCSLASHRLAGFRAMGHLPANFQGRVRVQEHAVDGRTGNGLSSARKNLVHHQCTT